jgi:dephospho-CoA kinase
VAAFLVTGNPGSGKTSLAAELASRGFLAVDPDYDAELSYWKDDTGTKTLKADGPADPDERWLRTHHWVWSRSRLQQIVRQHQAPVSVCGIALNIHQVVDLFDRIFLLRIDADTQEQRLPMRRRMRRVVVKRNDSRSEKAAPSLSRRCSHWEPLPWTEPRQPQ